jgi:hypothetical protein
MRDGFKWVATSAGGGDRETKWCWLELRAQCPDRSWNVTAFERWCKCKAEKETSGKSRRVVVPLGEEIHSVCQISARKAEITFLARNFDCIASTLCSPFVGWPTQSLAKMQPGKDEWHARRSWQDWPRACIAENTCAFVREDAGWNDITECKMKFTYAWLERVLELYGAVTE